MMTRWTVLLSAPYMQPVVDRFRSVFDEHGIALIIPPVEERLEADVLLGWSEVIDGAICGDDRFSRRVLERCVRLKVISKWGTGIDSIDCEAASELGIRVCNTPGAFTKPVADTAMCYVLCFSRQLPWMDRSMKSGNWHKLPGIALHEQTLGIIGVGKIGRAVAERAASFGMKLLGHDPVSPPSAFLEKTGMVMTDKWSLLDASDVVSLHCDLNPTSYHIMGESEFERVKSGVVLVNTARGPLVDEPALIRSLESGRVSGAGLDVFEQEPLALDSPLREMNHVMLAPHNSNTSPQAWDRVHEHTIDNLIRGLKEVKR